MKYLLPAIVFIEYDNRLFTRWRHFTHYQNPLRPGLHKTCYLSSSIQARRWSFTVWLGSVQVLYHTCEGL